MHGEKENHQIFSATVPATDFDKRNRLRSMLLFHLMLPKVLQNH